MSTRSILLAGCIALVTAFSLSAQMSGQHWIATWGTAQQLVRIAAPGRGAPGVSGFGGNTLGRGSSGPAGRAGVAAGTGPQRRFGIPPGIPGLNNQTVRMVVHTSVGGSSIRVRFSNALAGTTLSVGAAHIALRSKDSAIVAGSDRVLTFSGKPTATVYAGQVLVSDPIRLNVPALSDLAVSLYLPGDTGPVTSHTFGLHATYVSKAGDFTAAESISDPATSTQSYYWLQGVDVLGAGDTGTLVTFGDSITDGDQSTPDSNGMWPAVLAARLQANKRTAGIGVVNAGIAGNRLLGDNNGGLARFVNDALAVPGVKWISLLEGINDISAGVRSPSFSADDLIGAYKQIIESAHLRGVQVIGCTLTPFGGSSVFTDRGESIRTTLNTWIRTSGSFDAVFDFDAATRDAADPIRFRAAADSPDLLHPGDAGYKLMGNSVDLSIFSRKTRK